MNSKSMTLVGHLEELRKAILKSIVALLICSSLFFRYVDHVLFIIIRPVGKLVFIAPHEAFVTNVKIALFCGLFFSSPFIIFQIWQFISSGLSLQEKKYVYIFGPLSFLFFIVGITFGYFVIVPIAMKFLLGFSTSFISPMITIGNYVTFLSTLTLAFGLVFELPIVILFLTKIRLVSPMLLVRRRREAIVSVFILAAFLTPPDVITQVLMALPLLILYEISIIFSKIAYRRDALNG